MNKLSENIANPRKKANYSQEQLADLLGVSRQAVSKWELGDAQPDVDKLVRIGELFNVSTDQLIYGEAVHAQEREGRRMNRAELEAYEKCIEKNAPLMAGGVAVCILCPVPLFVVRTFLSGTTHNDVRLEQNLNLMAMVLLLVIVAIGVLLILKADKGTSEYSWIENERILPGPGAREQLKDWAARRSSLMSMMNWGICMCILGVVPLFIGAMFGDAGAFTGLCALLLLEALGVGMIICSNYFRTVVDAVEGKGDYTPEEIGFRKKYGTWFAVYWLVTVAIYLLWSFWTMDWDRTWIIFPPAGVLFAAVAALLKSRYKKEQSGTV